MESDREGGEVIWLGPAPLVGETQKEGNSTGLEILPGEARGLSHILGILTLGSDPRGQAPLTSLKATGAYHRALRN